MLEASAKTPTPSKKMQLLCSHFALFLLYRVFDTLCDSDTAPGGGRVVRPEKMGWGEADLGVLWATVTVAEV